MAAIAVAGIAATAAACGSNSNSAAPASSGGGTGPEKPDIVVATVPAEANAGLYIAQAKGLFTKVGLHVTVKSVQTTVTVVPAMQAGSVDVAGGQYPGFFLAAKKGIPMRILAAGYALGPHATAIIAPPSEHIQTPADLKGKTIAVNVVGSLGSDMIYTHLASYGITPSQVHLVPMPFPAMPNALAAGKIDAAYETEPFITEAVKRFGVQEVVDMDNGATQDLPITGYGVLASWAAKYPRTAAAFTKAIEQGNAIAATNLAVLQQVLAKALKLSPSITGVMATGAFPTTANAVQIQRVADLMRQYGQLKERLDVKPMIGS